MTTIAATRTVRLDVPIDVGLTWSALRHGRGDPTYRHVAGSIWRTSRMATGPVTVQVTQEADRVVRAEAWGAGADELLDGLPAALGTKDDVTGFSTAHPAIADAVRRFPGLRIPRTGRVMESLIPAVLEQRVVGLDAQASWRRLVQKHGEPAPGPAAEQLRVVPDAATWAALPVWEWHRAGVDPQRYRTAQACARVGPQLERVAAAGDLAATYRALRSVPGVGIWTAAETGSRALGDADAVPFGDFHLAHLVGVGLVGRRLHTDDEVAEVLEPYRPQRFRAVRLLALSPLVRMERRGPRAPRVNHHRI
ncbi:DNA-3-methyladenine glycosylase family protein [Aeromicrobium terrae]|uniref:DNA-3-methyladenine glycosylase 2 family protein n=1 Tax=Aeromicrobium terrae TaxID=2498846 RepID=A0A5C8NQC2_9ACTN|nr:DNA-3-methyladenine glycosylase [Aeromicrobium terrae]TXL63071.1 DNA-3-methyladenine glycosylase 2 family protein [Aeromicrobium terrae]